MASKKQETLLIVESPAKAKTIEKYLGPGYTVLASMGHLIDLPKSRLGINVEQDFEPEYITVRGKAKILKDLVARAKKADRVLLASDNDREGEAISYHIQRALATKNPNLRFERIVFNEITPSAIREAVNHPSGLSIEKINAQKARRVLDRIVGYNLSPILWQKVKNGLSAGRVQSVALRLICDREVEVENFIPDEYWTLDADFEKDHHRFGAQLIQYKEDRAQITSEAATRAIIDAIRGVDFTVSEVKETEKATRPRAPFTTSQLQQVAANRLGFTSRKTMQVAQQLYEGIAVGSNRLGLITYMRTDSVRVADSAVAEVRNFIQEQYPKELPPEPIHYESGKGAQGAHEAIRPTTVTYTPDVVKDDLTKDQFKLYSIIWERFVSSQMEVSRSVTVSVDIAGGDAVFRASYTRVVQKGFQRVLKLLAAKEGGKKLPSLIAGDRLAVVDLHAEQHFTSGPARYTDATIVKALEEKGIGRPSTYAPIISVLLDRYYVVRKNRQIVPTTFGRTINEILVKAFPDILDVNFTAEMESRLDQVEDAKEDWVEMIRGFYAPFKDRVDHAAENLESVKGVLDEPTDYICDKCGRTMIRKLGRFGFFLACSGFPECKNTKSVPLANCPRPGCGGQVVARRKSKGRGKEFYGCTNYPTCEFITHFKPLSSNCPSCGMFLVEKYDKHRGTHKACINPDCDYLHTHDEEEAKIELDES